MPHRDNVLIVGAGVIGLGCAYYAAQRGLNVTVVERLPATRDGCSFGNAGMIVPSHFIPLAAPGMVGLGLKWMWNPKSPFYIQPRLDADLLDWGWKFCRAASRAHVERSAPVLRDLHLASRRCFEEIAHAAGNPFGLVKKGLLLLCKSEETFAEESHAAENARRLGVEADVLDPRQTAALEPRIRMDITGSVFFPGDCHLSPGPFVEFLQAECVRLGVRFLWETALTGWTRRGRRILGAQTTQGDLAADSFVLCGGSWSPDIVRDLDLRIPIQAGKGYSLTLPKPRHTPNTCAILAEARIAVTPMGSTLRFGGTMELAGLQETINPSRIEGIVEAIPKYYPDFSPADFEGVTPWRGLRPCSPDGLPYLGFTRRHPNLCVATGHAMMGLSLAPITGKLVAQLLVGETPAIDLRLLDPDRYLGPDPNL